MFSVIFERTGLFFGIPLSSYLGLCLVSNACLIFVNLLMNAFTQIHSQFSYQMKQLLDFALADNIV